MHSERPLIKIISTGDGQGWGWGGFKASLADVKSHFSYLIYLKTEAGNPQSFSSSSEPPQQASLSYRDA